MLSKSLIYSIKFIPIIRRSYHFSFSSQSPRQNSFQSQLGRSDMILNRTQEQGDSHGQDQEVRETKTQARPNAQVLYLFGILRYDGLITHPRYGLSQQQIGSSLPFQKHFKLGIFHMKARYNNFWNYELGKEKEKYLYLLLEDLLSEMNYHQIYDMGEIEKVFGEVQKVLNEEFQKIRSDVQIEVGKVVEKSQYLEMKTQKQRDTVTMKAKMLGDYGGRMNTAKQEVPNIAKSKKNQLKSKLKAQIDSKYKANKQQPTQKPQFTSIKPSKDHSSQPTQLSTPQQSPTFPSKATISSPSPTQINLHNLLSNSICCSPSFQHNVLMYYVLILENVIRYETQLIKNPKFYEVYQKGVKSFVFCNRVEVLLKEIREKLTKDNKSGGSFSFKQLNQQIEKEIQFIKIIKATAITPSKNTNQHQLIDPHKLLTYLINYRHLNKSTPINNLLIDYLKLISTQKNEGQSGLSKVMAGLETEDRMMELAVGNKQFVKSLKQLYVEEKKSITKEEMEKVKMKEKQQKQKKQKKKQKLLDCKLQLLTNKPTYTLVECIFEKIDNWYQNKNQPTTK